MYDWPETRKALDQFWDLIKIELLDRDLPAPNYLQRKDRQMPLWLSPDLTIGQTCGWPYANTLRSRVTPFARFDYGLQNCPRGTYRSVYIGQSPEDRKYLENVHALSSCPSVAINGDDSQSGFHVFSEISGLPASETVFEDQRLITGAHRNSVCAVADGKARIAAIDAVAFELAKRHEADATENVHIIGYSSPKPGLPLITSLALASRIDELFQAIVAAHSKLTVGARDMLLIEQVLSAHDSEYEIFLTTD